MRNAKGRGWLAAWMSPSQRGVSRWSFPPVSVRQAIRSWCVHTKKKFHNGSNRIYISRAGSTALCFRCGKRGGLFCGSATLNCSLDTSLRDTAKKLTGAGKKKFDNDASLGRMVLHKDALWGWHTDVTMRNKKRGDGWKLEIYSVC